MYAAYMRVGSTVSSCPERCGWWLLQWPLRCPLRLLSPRSSSACGFVAIVVWTMAFLADMVVPRTVDGPARMTTSGAVAVDAALLLLFAVQHSVMARQHLKSWLRRRTPAVLERTIYVLATNLCLALLLAYWQPFGDKVWNFGGAAAVAAWSLCAVGWVLAIVSTFAVDHLELVGLRQTGWAGPRDTGSTAALSVSGLYGVVRHPLMSGLLLAF